MAGTIYTSIAEKRRILRDIYGGMMTLTDVARELGRTRDVARAWVRGLGLGTQIGKRVYRRRGVRRHGGGGHGALQRGGRSPQGRLWLHQEADAEQEGAV